MTEERAIKLAREYYEKQDDLHPVKFEEARTVHITDEERRHYAVNFPFVTPTGEIWSPDSLMLIVYEDDEAVEPFDSL